MGAGVLLAIAFPPADVGLLACIALTPLLWAWRGARARDAALYGFGFEFAFLIVLVWGFHYLGFVALVSLAMAASLYYAAIGALVAAFARRGMRSPFLTAAVWVIIENLRSQFPLGGLAWGEIGTALHGFGPARALASWGGVVLVTFVVVACNGLVLDGVIALAARRTRALACALAGLVGLGALTVVGDLARYQPHVTGRIRFAMLQGFDLEDAPTNDPDIEAYATRSHFGLAGELRGQYDLIVFPESSLNDDPLVDARLRDELVKVGKRHGAVVLGNARHYGKDDRLYNTNMVYDPDGTLQGTYAKQHLVPFGEYVPFRDALSFVGELRQIPYDFTAGTRRRLFRAGGHPFATVICYESAYSGLVREFVRDGAQAIVVSTSDRSYRRSGIAAQHLAMSQMRAAETGRPLLQAAVSGISAVVDADGNIERSSELFRNETITGSIKTTTGETPFVRFGDWVLVLAGLGLIAAAGYGAWRGRTRGAVDSAG